MDFNRLGHNRPQQQPQAPVAQSAAASAPGDNANGKTAFKQSRAYRWSFIALLLSGTALFIATIFFIVFGTPVNREAKYVKTDQYQAVFVNVNGTNGGQVYFGKITDLNSQYIRLANVFYIQNQTNQDGSSNGSYNLVKLGCELHGPNDEMLINRGEVFFWENLKTDSQVAQKAADFYKQNPNGQKCTDNNSSNTTQQSNGTTQAPAGGTTEANGADSKKNDTPAATTPPANTNGTTTNNTTNR